MDTLLTNQAGLDAFRTFLKSEFSEENVEFWLACEDFKKTESAEKIASKARMIYSEFIEADAPKEINIDFSTRDLISKNIAEPTLKCFDEAQKLIYSLMAKDSFPRFLKSEIYKKLGTYCFDLGQFIWSSESHSHHGNKTIVEGTVDSKPVSALLSFDYTCFKKHIHASKTPHHQELEMMQERPLQGSQHILDDAPLDQLWDHTASVCMSVSHRRLLITDTVICFSSALSTWPSTTRA
ncbi:hypothetical protein E5288_WYG009291 [Bos mutus]|uniref:RGS domain-containing protein n=1 Tax=Bos mutus TaxID=72004 RepID=A0A6B0S0H1_9CETA|nr:hypothetical protein [Bos mutus]